MIFSLTILTETIKNSNHRMDLFLREPNMWNRNIEEGGEGATLLSRLLRGMPTIQTQSPGFLSFSVSLRERVMKLELEIQ